MIAGDLGVAFFFFFWHIDQPTTNCMSWVFLQFYND